VRGHVARAKVQDDGIGAGIAIARGEFTDVPRDLALRRGREVPVEDRADEDRLAVDERIGLAEHLLRYCARPPFALERLSVRSGEDGRITRVRYVLPRHKAANWVGPGRGRKSTHPGANGVVELSPCDFLDRLADLVPPPRKHRHRYHGVFAPNHKLRSAVTALAIGNVGKRCDAATDGHAVGGHAAGQDTTGDCCDLRDKPRSHDTSRIAWAKLMARVGEEFPLECPGCGGDIRLIAFITDPGPIRKILTHLGEPLEPPPVSPARGPPTDWGELVQVHDDRAIFQASPGELPVIDIRSL